MQLSKEEYQLLYRALIEARSSDKGLLREILPTKNSVIIEGIKKDIRDYDIMLNKFEKELGYLK